MGLDIKFRPRLAACGKLAVLLYYGQLFVLGSVLCELGIQFQVLCACFRVNIYCLTEPRMLASERNDSS